MQQCLSCFLLSPALGRFPATSLWPPDGPLCHVHVAMSAALQRGHALSSAQCSHEVLGPSEPSHLLCSLSPAQKAA